ncbi:MAG: ADP-forming succinate--CoA ligase subunit beta [Desulfurococcaceae archaeon]
MKLYEYEAKEIAKKYGIPIPRGFLVESVEKAVEKASELGPVVLKAQVLVGGRGLAGGIKVANTLEEVEAYARLLLNTTLKGEIVEKILVEEKICVSKELYLSLTIDRSNRKLVYLVSQMGGVEIEELARKHPDKVRKIFVDPEIGYSSYMAREAVYALNLPYEKVSEIDNIMKAMYRIMIDYDAELVEFNPLALTCDGKLIALDAKILIDDNSLYKHQDLQPLSLRGLTVYEKRARELGFSYVELDGDIGVISNGAGLTMATMDLILYHGGKPLNFLDIGGGASKDRVKEAVKLMLMHPKTRVLLINIFGGITRCDEVARGIIEAINETNVNKPIVVRLLGTNEEEGKKILMEHGIYVYSEMDEAVKQAIKITKIPGD